VRRARDRQGSNSPKMTPVATIVLDMDNVFRPSACFDLKVCIQSKAGFSVEGYCIYCPREFLQCGHLLRVTPTLITAWILVHSLQADFPQTRVFRKGALINHFRSRHLLEIYPIAGSSDHLVCQTPPKLRGRTISPA
jgi:hypothetical protein